MIKSLLVLTAALTLTGCVVAPAPYRGEAYYEPAPRVYVSPPPSIYVSPPAPSLYIGPSWRGRGYYGGHHHDHWRGHR